MVVWICRIPFVWTHLGHEVHPASGKRIIRIDINGVYCHQATEIIRPSIVTVKRSVGVIGANLPHSFRRDDPSIVIFIEQPFLLYFIPRLL